MSKLSLEEVANLLGISSNSIINHVEKGRLESSKINNKGEDILVFEFGHVKNFAHEFLDIVLEAPEETQKDTDVKKGDVGESHVLQTLITELKSDYNNIIKQFTEYKEQAAFQIGQLKGQMESNQKMLDSGRKEVEEKELMIRKLKLKLKETQYNLEEEKKMLDEMSLFERIFKIKKK